MNDFFELENELRKLRPAPPSPVLSERIEQGLEIRTALVPEFRKKRWRFTEASGKWWSLGFGLAAAAVLILFADVTMDRRHEPQERFAQTATGTNARLTSPGTVQSVAPSRFVSAGGTNVVYNTRDEGLHFSGGSERPVRRVRYQTQQTWRWRNPETGASLRVSYPSEEIVLIPVSGQ